jgi:tRNA (adenine22-N1)-methyltransferase
MISSRLHKIATYLNSEDFILDIGSDHAYLPIYLMKNKLVKHVYASEINQGPYNHAQKNINKYQLKKDITLFLTSGLQNIPKDYNTITISGMGSTLMVDILSYSNLDNVDKIILQSNTNLATLRDKLIDFEIIDETFVEDNQIIYEIIVFQKTKKAIKYNRLELYFGPINLQKKENLFFEKYELILKNKENQLQKIPKDSNNFKIFTNLVNDLKVVLEKK